MSVRWPRGWVALCASMLMATAVGAAEVDQFTLPADQPVVLADSLKPLDAEVNRRIQRALALSNRRVVSFHPKRAPHWRNPGCNPSRLYQKLINQFGTAVVGRVESFAERDPNIARRQVAFDASIYQAFPWQFSPTLTLSERVASVIQLSGVEVGTDKLGHFFSEGYSYFVVTDRLHKPLESGLLFGEWSEAVYFGAQTTGVYSFADLTANFHGLRFWNRLLAQHPDPFIGDTPTPYIECRDDRWEQVRPFSWRDYVDAAWNERVNCPMLSSADLLAALVRQNATCEAERLPRYPDPWRERLLNEQGLTLLSQSLQPEVILRKRVALDEVKVSEDTLQTLGELRRKLEAWRRESLLGDPLPRSGP